jgi:hypothetical protein
MNTDTNKSKSFNIAISIGEESIKGILESAMLASKYEMYEEEKEFLSKLSNPQYINGLYCGFYIDSIIEEYSQTNDYNSQNYIEMITSVKRFINNDREYLHSNTIHLMLCALHDFYEMKSKGLNYDLEIALLSNTIKTYISTLVKEDSRMCKFDIGIIYNMICKVFNTNEPSNELFDLIKDSDNEIIIRDIDLRN